MDGLRDGLSRQARTLEQRARQACVVFPAEALPPGCTPSRARLGLEALPEAAGYRLYVARGVGYQGEREDVRAWLQRGELEFASLEELKRWAESTLPEPGGRGTLDRPASSRASTAPRAPGELTDLAAVRDETSEPSGPLYLDEESLHDDLAAAVRGQELALSLLAARVTRHVARVEPRRPATVYAVGPTGVGKTRSAEVLADALRRLDPGQEGYGYLRLDMSEYSERHRVSQLLGAPQGYVGYGDGAQLVDTLRANPRSIVLFDEIEKAHPDILRALMNAMDAGRLSSAAGLAAEREVDCRRAIFYFTSNLDASGILRDLEAVPPGDRRLAADRICRARLVQAGLRPELVGRIGCFLPFYELSADVRAEVVTLAIARVAAEYGLDVLEIEPGVVVAVLEKARGSRFGARPYDYVADELLGACFAAEARHARGSRVVLRAGPPVACEPAHPRVPADARSEHVGEVSGG